MRMESGHGDSLSLRHCQEWGEKKEMVIQSGNFKINRKPTKPIKPHNQKTHAMEVDGREGKEGRQLGSRCRGDKGRWKMVMPVWRRRLRGKQEEYLQLEENKGCTASSRRRAWAWIRADAGRPSGEETGLLLEHWCLSAVMPPGAGGHRERRELHISKICAFHSCARNNWSAMRVPNLLAALSVHAPGASAGSFNHRSGSAAFLTCLAGSYEIGECKISINFLQYVLFQPEKNNAWSLNIFLHLSSVFWGSNWQFIRQWCRTVHQGRSLPPLYLKPCNFSLPSPLTIVWLDLHLHSHSQRFLSHDFDHVVGRYASSHVKEKALRLVALHHSIFLIWSHDSLKHTLSNCLEQTQNNLKKKTKMWFP